MKLYSAAATPSSSIPVQPQLLCTTIASMTSLEVTPTLSGDFPSTTIILKVLHAIGQGHDSHRPSEVVEPQLVAAMFPAVVSCFIRTGNNFMYLQLLYSMPLCLRDSFFKVHGRQPLLMPFTTSLPHLSRMLSKTPSLCHGYPLSTPDLPS